MKFASHLSLLIIKIVLIVLVMSVHLLMDKGTLAIVLVVLLILIPAAVKKFAIHLLQVTTLTHCIAHAPNVSQTM